MIDFQGYLVIGLTLVVNAFFTGIGITLGVHFAGKTFLKKRSEEVDLIVKKVIEELEKRERVLDDAPKYLQE